MSFHDVFLRRIPSVDAHGGLEVCEFCCAAKRCVVGTKTEHAFHAQCVVVIL